MWFTKDDSKQGISLEKLKTKIIERLDHRTAEATRRLVKVNNSITNLSQTIEDAESKKYEAETRLQQLQEHTEPSQKTLDAIGASILEIHTLERTLEGWRNRFETLKTERAGLLHGVKQEIARAYAAVRVEVWRMVETRAATLQTLLISTEKVMEECRRVDCYVPALKGIYEVVPEKPYKGACPPVDLAKYLHENSRWWGSSSIQLEGEK